MDNPHTPPKTPKKPPNSHKNDQIFQNNFNNFNNFNNLNNNSNNFERFSTPKNNDKPLLSPQSSPLIRPKTLNSQQNTESFQSTPSIEIDNINFDLFNHFFKSFGSQSW